MNEFNYSQKVIYAKMMMAATPMFEKLSRPQQVKVVERVANELMKKISLEEACERDRHILAVDDAE